EISTEVATKIAAAAYNAYATWAGHAFPPWNFRPRNQGGVRCASLGRSPDASLNTVPLLARCLRCKRCRHGKKRYGGRSRDHERRRIPETGCAVGDPLRNRWRVRNRALSKRTRSRQGGFRLCRLLRSDRCRIPVRRECEPDRSAQR